MDSYSLKITGKVELSEELLIDKNYRIAIDGSIVNESHSPNHDGTLSKTYSLKPVHVLVHDELGDTIKARDIRSNSTKLRSLLKYKWDNGTAGTRNKEFDDFYDSFYKEVYAKMDYILANS